jgi:NAD(P)-dependent dehydrogenase (short-subunit alcohol dehydrogenase family)
MNKEWKDQLVVITGAGSGLGMALCANFVARGSKVLGLDLNPEALAHLREKLGQQFIPAKCDVTNHDEVTALLSRHETDVLINSAGITGKTNLKSYETDPTDIARVFQVNFFGSYHTSKAVLSGMASRGYGRVLHIASIAGKEGNAGMIGYSSSKAAVIGMAKVQGKEMAGTGVTVNALAPAVIQTPLVDAMPESQVKYMTDKIPMQRCGTLDELVAMAEFIVSPACSFTTGFTFDLSGGRATY